jgi:hypothetical protein
VILSLFLACATTDGAPPPQPPTPRVEAAPADDCVEQCMRQNMARAVDAAVIEADCRAACAKAPSADPALELVPR